MSHTQRLYSRRKGLHTTAKVAALIAALGFVTLMLEQPRLTASPSRWHVTAEESLRAADGAGAAASGGATGESALPASEHLPVYFPGQFPLPDGAIEPQPIGF